MAGGSFPGNGGLSAPGWRWEPMSARARIPPVPSAARVRRMAGLRRGRKSLTRVFAAMRITRLYGRVQDPGDVEEITDGRDSRFRGPHVRRRRCHAADF